MLEKKMDLADYSLAGTTRYSENMNIVVFSYINFELTLINQTTLNKKWSTHKNKML